MKSFKEIKSNYNFTDEDARLLVSIRDLMTDEANRTMETVDGWIHSLPDAAHLFRDQQRSMHIAAMRKQWFLDLFGGVYDRRYYEQLIRIGQAHVKVGVDAHYMNRSINMVRNFCIDIVNSNIDDQEERARTLIVVHKILDISLDVITASYIEEELRTYSPAYKVKNILLRFSERFSQSMNLILIIALIGLSLAVVGLFFYDISMLLSGNFEHGIITALGSLLVLWIMIELMNTEIKHLKGGRFRISVFVGVALVAFIRDTMIKALRHENLQEMYYLIPLILTLGIVFWLVTKSEERGF